MVVFGHPISVAVRCVSTARRRRRSLPKVSRADVAAILPDLASDANRSGQRIIITS